jgi:hypothetical protein
MRTKNRVFPVLGCAGQRRVPGVESRYDPERLVFDVLLKLAAKGVYPGLDKLDALDEQVAAAAELLRALGITPVDRDDEDGAGR